MKIKTTVDVNLDGIVQKLDTAVSDEKSRTVINNEFAKMCDPYIPMDEGTLIKSLEVFPQYIKYSTPYAHYMYIGQVYGPNIPIYEDGYIVGWFSPKGKKKHPTGREMHYSTDRHPLASKEWDKAMMRDRRDVFTEFVSEILRRRMK